MTVVFACKPIHLKDDLFRATQLDHRFSEELVADESIVNVVIFLFATPLLKLICRVVFFCNQVSSRTCGRVVGPSLCESSGWRTNPARMRCTSYFLSYQYFMRCPHVQYTMPALQCVRHVLHCDFGSTSTISHSSVFPAAIIASFDSLLKGLNAQCCWRSL